MHELKLFSDSQTLKLLDACCAKIGVPVEVFKALIRIELDQVGRQRRRGMHDQIDEVLDRCEKPENR